MSQSTLFLILGLCSVALVGIIAYVAYALVKTLHSANRTIRSAQRVLDGMQDITHDVQELKDTVKTDIIGSILQFTRLFSRR